jgi:LacI family repressor for deo operon, udp, cdd, tsx, nupC, and nupG
LRTIKDVAQAAKVSVATVSRVLNHDEKVSPQTRERVLQVVRQLGYTPNVLGRNLRMSATNRILVLLPTLSNQFYSRIIRGIEQTAQLHGFQVMLSTTHSDAATERGYLELLYNRSVDGIILLSSELSPELLSETASKYPLVMCSEYVEGARLSAVTVDNFQAAYDAVTYLVETGNERVALIGNQKTYSGRLRTKGYLQALRDHGIPVEDRLIVGSDYSFQSGVAAAGELLTSGAPPSAVFTVSDVLAAGVLKQLVNRGKTAGSDMDVLGFDNTSLAKMLTPALSTVSQPRAALGKRAMELLIDKMNDLNCADQSVFLPHELVIRETTKKC